MIRSLHPPLCQCGNVLSPGHSALQCPTLPEVTQKLAPCPPSQLPQSQLSAQLMKPGEAALLRDADPKLLSSSSCSLTCWTSRAAEGFPGNSFSSIASLPPTPLARDLLKQQKGIKQSQWPQIPARDRAEQISCRSREQGMGLRNSLMEMCLCECWMGPVAHPTPQNESLEKWQGNLGRASK